MQRLLLTLCFSILFAANPAAYAADLTITVNNVKSDKGQIRITLYNQSAKWLKLGYKRVLAPAATGTVSAVFSNLPSGEYAVALFHDEDSDEKMAKNLIGIPTEPVGFSNDARGTFGPPAFDAVKLNLEQDNKTISITLF
ncbi:MAG: DUF2141 domain-containing protein [Pseudomonadota bacterium]